MRVKISVNKFTYSDYLNIDPDPLIYDGLDIEPSSIRNLDVLDDRECDEIILDECLSYIPHQELGEYITNVSNKIRRGGKLIILATDSKKLCFDYYTGVIDEETFNAKMFGDQSRPSLFKTSCLSISLLKEYVSERFKIEKIMNIDEYSFVLEIKVE